MEAPQSYIDDASMMGASLYLMRTNTYFVEYLRAADEGIANITMTLQGRNLLDNTIIIFTTDNGAPTPSYQN